MSDTYRALESGMAIIFCAFMTYSTPLSYRNGITNNNLLCVEIPPNVRVCINSWNIGVARWINTCKRTSSSVGSNSHARDLVDVYQRVFLSKSTGKPTMISTISSFFISALWHVSTASIASLRRFNTSSLFFRVFHRVTTYSSF